MKPLEKKEKAHINTDTMTRPQATNTNQSRDDRRNRIDSIRDNHRLIASDPVEGTTVYDSHGDKIGTVRQMIIEKRSGEVRHVILGYRGLFGMGEENFALPWDALEYDEKRDGYVSRVANDRMRSDKAPRYGQNDNKEWNADYEREVTLYYFPA